MARRKRRGDEAAKALRRQQWREAIPHGVSLDDLGDLCRNLRDSLLPFGCRGGEHALTATREFLLGSDGMYDVRDEVVAWLALVGGVCDCTVESRALRRVLRLSEDDRDAEWPPS